MFSPRPILCGFLSCFPLLAGGCGGPRPVPVEGMVTIHGNVVERATVTFFPEDGGMPAVGMTDEEGRFELSSGHLGDGAFPGKYKVLIQKTTMPPIDPGDDESKALLMDFYKKPPGNDLPAIYNSWTETPFADIIVPSEGKTDFHFDLQGFSPRR